MGVPASLRRAHWDREPLVSCPSFRNVLKYHQGAGNPSMYWGAPVLPSSFRPGCPRAAEDWRSLKRARRSTPEVIPEAAGVSERSASAAFTLIEVILAIGIAAGVLMVVLFFYGQSESLRTQLLQENARISAARLVMERLSRDLSAARWSQSYQQGLSGGADNLQFVRLSFPLPSAWTNSTATGSLTPVSTLRLVSYSLGQGTNGSASGLVRSEQALSRQTGVVPTNPDQALFTQSGAVLTNADQALFNAGAPAPRGGVTIEQLQFLRFRYYDGTNWLEAWSGASLPAGIEVSLGMDPLPAELTADEYPYELYRRVIFLPNSPSGITSTRAGVGATGGPG